jgi:Ca-activated chloride channel family protein
MPQFEWPAVLLALLALPFLGRLGRRGRAPALRITGAVDPAVLPRSARQRWVRLPAALRMAALALLICALAGPRWNGRHVPEISKTIGIQLVVDCSGSMNETDMLFEGRLRSRMEVVRQLSRDFVLGNGADLKGRMQNTIGVIAFAEFPVTLRPLMLPDRAMGPVLEHIGLGSNTEGTSIGDAVAMAAARFHQAETTAGESFRSKVIVLLTDGDDNSSKISVERAGVFAQQWGVRIYAIAIRPSRQVAMRGADPAMEALDSLAQQTGGLARLVTDGYSLQTVYREIDGLERSERRQPRYSAGWQWIYALTTAGLSLLVAEIVLTQTWLRRIP